jgi:GT2 family glycosyltransferase
VAFLDSDDEWLPEKLEKELEVFRNSDREVGLVYTGKMILDESSKLLQVRMPTLSGCVHEAMLGVNFIGSCSRVTVKKQVLDKVAGFDETFPNCQDYDLWLRVARVSRVACVPYCLVKRYLLSDRMTASLRNICDAWERILNKYRGEMEPRTLARHLARVAIVLLNYDRRRARALAWEALRFRPLQPGLLAALALSVFGKDCYRWLFGRVIKLIDKHYLGRAKI